MEKEFNTLLQASSAAGEMESATIEEAPIPQVQSPEGKQVESKLFKSLLSFMDHGQALQAYEQLKTLGEGEYKNSKLRDENGELMIVWHGSSRKFDAFNPEADGEFRWRNTGIHFSSSRETIEQFAKKGENALRQVIYDLGVELHKVNLDAKLSREQLASAYAAYNEMVEDFMEHGEDSRFYHKGYVHGSDVRKPDMDYFSYGGKRRFGTGWALEMFAGKLPTKETVTFNQERGLYLGNDFGVYEYAAVCNIEDPFCTDEAEDMDAAFELGEESHAENNTDGTILYHKEAAIGQGGFPLEETKGSYSAGVFDMDKIKIIGRTENGKLVLLNQ